jgi:aminopeptidase N
MQGAGLLTETLAQYSALMVMRRLHGEDGIRRFLQFQLDRYLSGRRTQVLGEEPLVSVEVGQQQIAYGKGPIAMYLLQRRMGEEAVNRALRRFVERYRFTTPPYPRSVDLIALLREEARTPEQQALITDLFERITVYDLRVDRPTAVRRPDGRWDVTVPVEARKAYADRYGNERQTPLNEPIEVGLFTAAPDSVTFDRRNVLMMELHPIRTGRQVLRFVTDRPPTHAGVDPFNFYIDRNSGDNVESVTS